MTPALEALLVLLALDKLPRTGWLMAGVPNPETVAAHSHGAALLALCLADRLPAGIDVDRTVALLVAHDAAEALCGDLPQAASRLLPPGAKRTMEQGAAERLLDPAQGERQTGTPPSTALARWLEAADRQTPEAQLAKAFDRLHLGLRLLGYVRAGQGGLDEFVAGLAGDDFSEWPALEELRTELLAELGSAPSSAAEPLS